MSNTTHQSLIELFSVLDEIILGASHHTYAAALVIRKGERNGAIGTILPAAEKLEAANALLRAILVLHRQEGAA
ncbi:MAG: hypothetical protein R3D51_03280 [Hyphomicrobiaceae bacterium]